MQAPQFKQDHVDGIMVIAYGALAALGVLASYTIKILNPTTQFTPLGCAVGCGLALPFSLCTAVIAALAVSGFSEKHISKTSMAVFSISALTHAYTFSIIQSRASMPLQLPSSVCWYGITLLMVLGALSYLEMRRQERSQQLTTL